MKALIRFLPLLLIALAWEIAPRIGLVSSLALPPLSGVFCACPNASFDLPFAVRIADATRQGDNAVVGEDIAVQRIERRIVDVRGEDAFFEIVEDDHGFAHLRESYCDDACAFATIRRGS